MRDDPSIYRKILALQYELVYISPERTLCPDGHFWKLLGKVGKGFIDSVAYVVVDEAHCMEIWGKDFRPEYANLAKLRPYLPNVPFVAATATANANQLVRIKQFLCIRPDSITVHETVNRKNLFYGIKEIGGRGDGQLDLDFVVPLNKDMDTYSHMKPTIIYCDTYEDCRAVAKYLRRRISRDLRRRPKLNERTAKTDVRACSEVLISVYYANLSDTIKSYIEADWRQGRTKVLVSTSAWGMGIHDTHVERVIQWKAKMVDCLNTLIQRWGRCARDPKIHGMCFFFVEKQFFGSRGSVGDIQIRRFKVSTDTVKRKNKTQEETRAEMETGLYRLINPPTEDKCRRKIILNYYGDPLRHEDSQNLVNNEAPCCDQCGIPDNLQLGWASSVFAEPYVYIHPSNAPPVKVWHHVEPLLVERIKKALISLCRLIFAIRIDLNTSKLWTRKSILTDKQIQSLATHATSINETDEFYKIQGIKWSNRISGSFTKLINDKPLY